MIDCVEEVVQSQPAQGDGVGHLRLVACDHHVHGIEVEDCAKALQALHGKRIGDVQAGQVQYRATRPVPGEQACCMFGQGGQLVIRRRGLDRHYDAAVFCQEDAMRQLFLQVLTRASQNPYGWG